MYYREIATKSGHKISAKRRSFNCAVLPLYKGILYQRNRRLIRSAEEPVDALPEVFGVADGLLGARRGTWLRERPPAGRCSE